MTSQEETLIELVGLLSAQRIPYMVVGGMANAVWGVPRSTLDIDVTIWAEERPLRELVEFLAAHYHIRVSDPEPFAARTRVLPLTSRLGVAIDLIFGLLPFEQEAIARAVDRPVADTPVRFVSAEDLILMKIISQRSRDQEDARQILLRRRGLLDRTYLDPRVAELSHLLEAPEILLRLHDWA